MHVLVTWFCHSLGAVAFMATGALLMYARLQEQRDISHRVSKDVVRLLMRMGRHGARAARCLATRHNRAVISYLQAADVCRRLAREVDTLTTENKSLSDCIEQLDTENRALHLHQESLWGPKPAREQA